MPTTYSEAYDTITNKLILDWATNAANIVGTMTPAPELRFTDVEKGEIPEGYFARFTMQPVFERQRTFRNGEDQRYQSSGVIIIQVFAPRSDQQGAERQRLLAEVARGIFRGKTFDGCIWFRNVRINRLDAEAKYLRTNVVMEYEFDEIG